MAQRCELGTGDRAVNHASAEPEVAFRIVHVALDDGFPPTDGSPPPSYREQAVERTPGILQYESRLRAGRDRRVWSLRTEFSTCRRPCGCTVAPVPTLIHGSRQIKQHVEATLE